MTVDKLIDLRDKVSSLAEAADSSWIRTALINLDGALADLQSAVKQTEANRREREDPAYQEIR